MTPQPTQRGGTLAGIGLMLLGMFLFCCNDALGKWLLGTYSIFQMLVIRSFAAMLILAPFLWRFGRNLAMERAERIRSQERAEVAAHLHDSVLQTLALMQKRADDPREVAALARRQERELRDWLAGDGRRGGEGRFAAALRCTA